jgi:hypothetical protein
MELDGGGTSTTAFIIAADGDASSSTAITRLVAAGAEINGTGTLVIGAGTLSLNSSFTVEGYRSPGGRSAGWHGNYYFHRHS